MKTAKPNYKTLALPFTHGDGGDGIHHTRLRRAAAQFNAAFPADELQLEYRDKQLHLLLHSADLTTLRRQIRQWQDDPHIAIYRAALHAVENIKSYGMRGGKRHYVDYNKERKVAARKSKEAKRAPYFYAHNHPHEDKNSAAPPRFVNAIVRGDSDTVLQQLPDNCVDIVFTSPPYNFGLAYQGDDDSRHWQEYFDKLYAVLRQCIRVLKYGGRLVVNIQPLYSDYIPSHHMLSHFLMQEKMIWKGEILWEKNNYNCKYTAWGSWKSPSNPYLKYTWEFIEVFCKGDLKKRGARDDIDIAAEDFKKWTTGKWSIAPERAMQKYGHPAMFPEELVRRVLQLFSYENDLVLDPFNGVGSTTAVAKRLNRRYLGIDISPAYCRTAKARLEEEKAGSSGVERAQMSARA